MPSTKKRINLTVPDTLYEQLQKYKAEMGISSDATACLQLVTQQLNGHKYNQLLIRFLQEVPLEQIQAIASEGIGTLKKSLPYKFDATQNVGN